MTVGKLTNEVSVVVQSLPSIHEFDADMVEKHRSKFQGKSDKFDFHDYASAICTEASVNLDNFKKLLKQSAIEEIERKAKMFAELKANAPPLTGDEIFF